MKTSFALIIHSAFSNGWGEDITHFTQGDAVFAAWVSGSLHLNVKCYNQSIINESRPSSPST